MIYKRESFRAVKAGFSSRTTYAFERQVTSQIVMSSIFFWKCPMELYNCCLTYDPQHLLNVDNCNPFTRLQMEHQVNQIIT